MDQRERGRRMATASTAGAVIRSINETIEGPPAGCSRVALR
ncbi:hypothetical protein ACWGDX_07475 [Streptomyces sp. NPDC055025]